jgi:cytochrome P450
VVHVGALHALHFPQSRTAISPVATPAAGGPIDREADFGRDFMTLRVLAEPLNRDGLFFKDNAEWKWQRLAMSPGFRREKLLSLVPVFAACAEACSAAGNVVFLVPGTLETDRIVVEPLP